MQKGFPRANYSDEVSSVAHDTVNPPLVIVTDDHRMTRHMIRSILEADGLKVLEAANGREALELFTKNRVDLMVSDIMMPVLDGLELCARLKELPEARHGPVLVFTAQN
jgi:CheY-like chemotaxis protein